MITQVKKWVTDHPVWFAILFFIFYFTGFFTLEHLVTEPVYLLHCGLDDLIPFNEWFIFPYASWFGLIPWALITLLLFDRKNYFYLCGVMFSGMALCLLLYLIFPNGVDLRPQEHRIEQSCSDLCTDDLVSGYLDQCLPVHSCCQHLRNFSGGAAQQNLEAQKACSWNLRCAHRYDLLVHPVLETAFGD